MRHVYYKSWQSIRRELGSATREEESTMNAIDVWICRCVHVYEIDLAASKLFGECVTVCHSIIRMWHNLDIFNFSSVPIAASMLLP